MLEIPGLGARKIRVLHEQLGISSIAGLAQACGEGRVAVLAGFGEKTQKKLLAGIRNREAYARRHLWWDAFSVAEPILQGLRALPQVRRAEHAGSLRRRLETVGDLDFLVAAEEWAPVVDWFITRPEVAEVTAKGETKASVRFAGGLQADLRIVPPAQFVFALHHFTGAKEHNVQLRQRALARGLSLSEWGLVPSDGEGTAKAKAGALLGTAGAAAGTIRTEAELFAALDLHEIPPELREGLGEIEAAEQDALPRLVEADDIRGVFHNHTTASDGRNTLGEMVAAAQALGWEYLGIADHSKASFQANGLNEARLRAQVAEIDPATLPARSGAGAPSINLTVKARYGTESDEIVGARLAAKGSALDGGSILNHQSPVATAIQMDDLAVMKRALARSLRDKLKKDGITITRFAQQIGTGRTAARRILDEHNTSITLSTMNRAANALGYRLVLQTQAMTPQELGRVARALANTRSERTAKRLKAQLVSGFYGNAKNPA